jgi:ribosomal protein S18 acetylase RimI-like enzyme
MIKILNAKQSDAGKLVQLGKQTFAETFVGMQYYTAEIVEGYTSQAFTLDKMQRDLADPKIKLLLIELNGELAGYVKLVDRPLVECVQQLHAIYLERFYFLKAFQRMGIGQAAMEAVKSLARELGFSAIWLSVWEYNVPAVNFYRKHAFEHVGEWDWAFEFAGTRYVDRDWIFVRSVVTK